MSLTLNFGSGQVTDTISNIEERGRISQGGASYMDREGQFTITSTLGVGSEMTGTGDLAKWERIALQKHVFGPDAEEVGGLFEGLNTDRELISVTFRRISAGAVGRFQKENGILHRGHRKDDVSKHGTAGLEETGFNSQARPAVTRVCDSISDMGCSLGPPLSVLRSRAVATEAFVAVSGSVMGGMFGPPASG